MLNTQPHGDRDPRTFQAAVGVLQRLELEVFQCEVRSLQRQRTQFHAGAGGRFAVANSE